LVDIHVLSRLVGSVPESREIAEAEEQVLRVILLSSRAKARMSLSLRAMIELAVRLIPLP